jgi:hypothetical protein
MGAVRGLVVDLVAALFLGLCWAAYYDLPVPGIHRFLRPARGPLTLAVLSAASVAIAILIAVQIARLH